MLTIIIIALTEIFILWIVINCIKLNMSLVNVLKKGKTVEGEICGINIFEGSHRNCYVPLLKFKYEGKEVQAQSLLALKLRSKNIKVGSSVLLKYNPNYPGMVVMNNKLRISAVIIINTLIIIGGVLFLVGSVSYIIFSIYRIF